MYACARRDDVYDQCMFDAAWIDESIYEWMEEKRNGNGAVALREDTRAVYTHDQEGTHLGRHLRVDSQRQAPAVGRLLGGSFVNRCRQVGRSLLSWGVYDGGGENGKSVM